MALTYSRTPVLNYGGEPTKSAADNSWRRRFPPEAQPIATAPLNTSTPIEVYEPNGEGWLAIHHRGQWQKLREDYDDRTGATSIVMEGSQVTNPVAWCPHTHKRRD